MEKNLNLCVGTRIGDWVVCRSDNDSIELFPLVDQTTGNWSTANTFCSNFNISPLNGWAVTSSRMPSISDWKNIVSQTGMSGISLTNNSNIWLSDYYNYYYNDFYAVASHSSTYYQSAHDSHGVRPLITITLIK